MEDKIKIEQGDVFWLEYTAPGYDKPKPRPCVVVSGSWTIQPTGDVLVVPMSSSIRRTDLPCNVPVGDILGVGKDSWIKTNQMMCISASQLTSKNFATNIGEENVFIVLYHILRQLGVFQRPGDDSDLQAVAEAEAAMGMGAGEDRATYPVGG